MTWGELKTAIAELGFEGSDSYTRNKSAYLAAVNRAINLIASTVRPIIGRYVISQHPLQNLLPSPLYNMDIKQYQGNPISYKANNVKSYYFECDGTGIATLSNETQDIVIDMQSNREFKAYRGLVNGDVTLAFTGDYAYNIRNLAMYGQIYSDNVEDIPPYAQNIKYDIEELTKESGLIVFSDFALDKPIMQGSFSSGNSYKIVQDYQIEQRRYIYLNGFDIGEFEVWYKRRPKLITDQTPNDFVLELDYDVHPLVPLLAAHYIWLDDEERKAVLYWNEYDDLRSQIMMNTPSDSPVTQLENVTGW